MNERDVPLVLGKILPRKEALDIEALGLPPLQFLFSTRQKLPNDSQTTNPPLPPFLD